MELQEQDIVLLEAYLAGELEGEALLDCEARLKREPELAETLAMLRAMHTATAQTAKVGLQQEMKAAKAAALAAGMDTYTPSVNAPKTRSFLGSLMRFLIKLGITLGIGWAVWKFVLHEKWPPQIGQTTIKVDSSTTKTSTKTIRRDTIRSSKRVPKQNGTPSEILK
ncbi:MAG: hypothetical protein IPN95_06930 [Bacteroidetes bacterium]|nr:hypothetical protein [Bacteroidota bacterium]MBL0019157.1 hypothetical protein [Bacteroidota bacterium]MBP6640365.1 hypothetical protein [Bacteroidia bacterium]